METDNENPNRVESRVRELQANLFPPSSKICSSYFDNFLIKTNTTLSQDEDEGKDLNPKDFLSFNREVVFTPQQPRWPTECQVLEERVIHINYAPPSPEPYYNVTGKEVQPKPAGEECGLIVYQYIPMSAVNYFSRSSVGGSKYLLSTCICPEEDTLRFESRFESGNLARAIRITPSYYELYLRADLYTSRHMQWFYFRITNMKKNFIYRFAIVNLTKEESLFNEGMKPLMYSTKDSQLHSIGWRRCGDNITYYCNENVSPEDEEQQMTYTLTFTMEFPHENDEVYLAHSCPYTYSDLQDYLIGLTNHPVKSTFSTLRLLCKSLAGNNVYYLTITSPPVAGEIKRKKAIVVTARVHPGETPASWMMKGFIDFLTSDSMSAKELRDKFIFKLVPMLNPDGVVVGNNRCSLSAKDLNRQYRTVMRDAYPSIWYTKLMVRRLLEECGVAMYCDLHAHSRKHNIFIYGCESRRASEKRLQEQVFPLMLHKNAADKFSFENCQFRIQKIKEGTGRVVMWMMGIPNSYTMEATFAGSTLGTRADTHFSTQDLEQMGRSFCQTLLDFYDEDPRKERLRIKIVDRLLQEGSNADEPANIQLSDYSSDQGDTSCSSSEDVKDEDVANFFLPVVPPPSPILPKKQKPKFTQSKAKMGPKTPNLSRKYLPVSRNIPICKATLGLSSEESNQSSSDSENYIAEITGREKVRSLGRRRRKKKLGRIKQSSKNHTGTEMHVKTRSISVFDVMSDKPLPQSQRRSKTPLPRVDKRQNVSQELAQVQAKLSSLKHKLWYGVENGSVDVEAPLSWGRSSMTVQLSTGDMVISRNNPKIRAEKPTNARASSGVKHPSATDWMTSDKPVRIRKSSSLPDSTVSAHKPKIKTLVFSCDDGMKHDKKKKKAKSKLPKKVKNTTKMKITFD